MPNLQIAYSQILKERIYFMLNRKICSGVLRVKDIIFYILYEMLVLCLIYTIYDVNKEETF